MPDCQIGPEAKMHDDTIEDTGFTAPAGRALGHERRSVALAALIASIALAISTLVAATVVTIGIAHASVADGVIDNEGRLFAAALLLGLIFIGIGGFTIRPPRRH
jgi:hypothetical protein